MSIPKILVGSYNDAIYTLAFDPAPSSGTPTLELVSQVHVGSRPSWIEAHPSDGSLVFASLELEEGQIVVVKYDKDGRGHHVAEATCTSGGSVPCTLYITEHELTIGNYMEGTVATLPISMTPPYTNPAQLRSLAFPFESNPSGRDPSRQEAAHPHQTVRSRANTTEEELLVPDLGGDIVWRLTKDPDGRWAIRGNVRVPTGGGPRHVATYGNTLYVLLELTSELAVYTLHAGQKPPIHVTTLSTLSVSPTPYGMTAAEILLPKPNRSFPTAYIYTSNREDPHVEGDTIAIFSLEKGEDRPELVNEVRTGLRHVRSMAFGGEDDKWLVVGGVGSMMDEGRGGGVKVFQRVHGGRDLRQVAELDSEIGSTLKATVFWWL